MAIEVTTFCHLTKAYHKEIPRNCGHSLDASHIWRQMWSPHKTGFASLYRAGMTSVVLHWLFMQQNQRV